MPESPTQERREPVVRESGEGEGIPDWGLIVQRVLRYRGEDFGDTIGACAVRSIADRTLANYLTHLKALRDRKCTMGEYLAELAARGLSASWLRTAVSAGRFVEDIGLAAGIVAPVHWRMCKATGLLDRREHRRPFGGPGQLSHMWDNCSGDDDRRVVVLALLSIVYLLRVSEVSALRPRDVGERGLSYTTSKTGYRVVTMPVGPVAAAWLRWLVGDARARGLRPSEPFHPGGPAELERSMCRLLGGSEWETYRWHSWRRGGAFALAQSGAPSRVLMWFGGWVTPAIARAYCSPEEPIPFVASWSVPTISDDGVWSRKRMSWKKLWPAVVVAQLLPSARIRPFPPKRPGEGEFGPGGAKGKRGTGVG